MDDLILSVRARSRCQSASELGKGVYQFMRDSKFRTLLRSFLWLMASGIGATAFAQHSPTPATGQTVRPAKSQSGDQQMSTGVLALQSQQAGVLFVDGQRVQIISSGSVTTLKLTSGGHFVDLRDQDGNTLWQKIIEVPVAAQV